MRSKILMATIMLASLAHAKEPKHFQTGVLLQMDSAECGYGEMLGTDSGHKKTHALLCQEYILQSDRVIYRIRPKDDKHPVLLPVGENAQFRLDKDKMMLRVEDLDSKEREYIVVSMTPRENSKTSDSISSKMNHRP